MYKKLNDNDLMNLVKASNHDAFTEIVYRYTDQFFALAMHSLQHHGDAQDVVQSAFIKLWQNPSAWHRDKSKFTTWFYRVVVNACHDHRRKHKRMISVTDDVLEAAGDLGDSEEDLSEQKQQQELQKMYLERAIVMLPAAQRDALNLVVYSELPQKQAAQIMGLSLKALESLLFRAKKSLTKKVNEISNESLTSHTYKAGLENKTQLG